MSLLDTNRFAVDGVGVKDIPPIKSIQRIEHATIAVNYAFTQSYTMSEVDVDNTIIMWDAFVYNGDGATYRSRAYPFIKSSTSVAISGYLFGGSVGAGIITVIEFDKKYIKSKQSGIIMPNNTVNNISINEVDPLNTFVSVEGMKGSYNSRSIEIYGSQLTSSTNLQIISRGQNYSNSYESNFYWQVLEFK